MSAAPTPSRRPDRATPRFTGWPPAMFDFWAGLEAHNDRGWFREHREAFERDVRAPMETFLAAVEPEVGPGKVFRLQRDVRFSNDKTPYKTVLGATVDRGGAGMLYLHVDRDGVMVGSGCPAFDARQLERFRRAVDAERTGAELARVVRDLRRAGHAVGVVHDMGVGTTDLKRVPRPYAPDHPRGELLRMKRIVAARTYEQPAWLHTARARSEILRCWHRQQPLADWLAAHVGPPAGSRPRR